MQSKEELINLLQKSGVPEDKATLWAKYLCQLDCCSLHSAAIQTENEEAWLAARTHGIGGSDIAAIMGESDWKSAYDIWLTKTGQFASNGEEHPQSEAARWGNVLEDAIAYEWAHRNNKQIIKIPVSLKYDKAPYMLANIDGFVLSDDRETITGILEIKTTSAYNNDAWEVGPLPYYYICQATWYTMITGLPCFDIVCLVGGQKLYDYHIPKDQELCERMYKEADHFWNVNVKQLIEPKLTAVDAEKVTKAEIAADPDELPLVDDSDATNNIVTAYLEARTKCTALEKIKKALYAEVFQAMRGKANLVTQNNTVKVSRSVRRSCDFDALARDFPEAYAATVSSTTSSKLIIS